MQGQHSQEVLLVNGQRRNAHISWFFPCLNRLRNYGLPFSEPEIAPCAACFLQTKPLILKARIPILGFPSTKFLSKTWQLKAICMADAKLIVVGGDIDSKEIDLSERFDSIGSIVVGRGRDSDLTLSHPLVSRRHCEIVSQNGAILVRDLGSMNGTFVGTTRVSQTELNDGDLLTVGTVTFRASIGSQRKNLGGACDTVEARAATENTIRFDRADGRLRPHIVEATEGQ